MPLKQLDCDMCSCSHTVCPECESRMVTPRENMYTPSPNEIIDFGGEKKAVYKHVCWDCGWTEEVTLEVSRENI